MMSTSALCRRRYWDRRGQNHLAEELDPFGDSFV